MAGWLPKPEAPTCTSPMQNATHAVAGMGCGAQVGVDGEGLRCVGTGGGAQGWVVVRRDELRCTVCGAQGQTAVHNPKSISGILHGILRGWQWVSWNVPPCRLFIASSPPLFQLLLEMSPS